MTRNDEHPAIARTRAAPAAVAPRLPTLHPPMGFPMEMSALPGRTWIVSHKRIAFAAQLGKMGLHRSVTTRVSARSCGSGVCSPPRFIARRNEFLRDVVKPLTQREESVYVVHGSDAEKHVRARFTHEEVRHVTSSLRPTTGEQFFAGLPLVFQRGPARGWRATFHFDLTGDVGARGTVVIDDGELEVLKELVGTADVAIRAPFQLWLDIVTKRRSPVFAVLTRKLVVKGDRKLLEKFASCFPR